MLLSDRKWSDEYLEDFQIPLALVFQAQASCHATHGTHVSVSYFLVHVCKPCIYIFSKLIWKASREISSLTKQKYGKVVQNIVTPRMSRRAAPNCFLPSLTTAKVPPVGKKRKRVPFFVTFCSVTLKCVCRISWKSKAKDHLPVNCCTHNSKWHGFHCLHRFVLLGGQSYFSMFAKPMDLAMLEAPAPIFQHERRHLMSCSDAVFSMNGCQISCSCIKLMLQTSQKKGFNKKWKKIPPKKWASNQWRCWWWWHSSHRIQGHLALSSWHAQQWSICLWWKKSSTT